MSSGPWRVTVRSASRVERSAHATLAAALDQLELEAGAIVHSGQAQRKPVEMRIRTFEPVQQVAARVEVSGPGRLAPKVKAGLDIRGDGSVEAFIGRPTRRLVEQHDGESPAGALRRALGELGS